MGVDGSFQSACRMACRPRVHPRPSLAERASLREIADAKTKPSSSLAPLGERGDRKAEGAPRFAGRGGEGVSTNMNARVAPTLPLMSATVKKPGQVRVRTRGQRGCVCCWSAYMKSNVCATREKP